ncbi:hypothetical protein ASE82_17410 [Sphingomonas sp. Leaf230]|nr:hypothetical protein ASE82_17410 [Sphingomonas sp. Leaf230]
MYQKWKRPAAEGQRSVFYRRGRGETTPIMITTVCVKVLAVMQMAPMIMVRSRMRLTSAPSMTEEFYFL